MPRSRRDPRGADCKQADAFTAPPDRMSIFRKRLLAERGERLIKASDRGRDVARALTRLNFDECFPVYHALDAGRISVPEAADCILEMARDLRRPSGIPKWWAGE